jgi:hypothetical protein
MADNVGYTPGSGAVVAADEIDGVLFQRMKLTHGVDGTAVDVSDVAPMPVQEVGGASSVLTRILSMLMSPMGFDRSLSRQRVTALVESGTVTAVTTVTTVTTMATLQNVGNGRTGIELQDAMNRIAWAQVVRARIT